MGAADDPYDLERFVGAQEGRYQRALAEIRAGEKRSHWMWYIFPQLAGLGFSPISRKFAIAGLDEARAYLAHPILGPRLTECAEATVALPDESAHDIFGSPDDWKLRSSATLFALVTPAGSVFQRVLEKYFQGERDPRTLQLLGLERDAAPKPSEEGEPLASSGASAGDHGEHVCSAEHAGWLVIPGRTLFNNPRRILGRLVRSGDVVLDLGCGPGFFTLPLARMVGETGRVIAVDVQQRMLDSLRARAKKAGLESRIRFELAGSEVPGAHDPADLALAFWMVHEVPDKRAFMDQVFASVKPGGGFLLVEPLGHVGRKQFVATVALAEQAGFTAVKRPRIGFSRAALFQRP